MCCDRIPFCRERVSEKHPQMSLQLLWKCYTQQNHCWLLGEKSDSFQNGKSRTPLFASPGLERMGHKTCNRVTLGNHSFSMQCEGRVLNVISVTPEISTRSSDMWGSFKTLCGESSTQLLYPYHLSSTRTYTTWFPSEKNLFRAIS
jgi:hypothetical protein